MATHNHQNILEMLQRSGLRPTRARRIILELLAEKNRHFTPEEMLDTLRERGQPLSIATLYQNLAKLVEKGLVIKIVGLDGSFRYDFNHEPHNHMVCQRCGKIVDVVVSGPLDQIEVQPHDDDDAVNQWQILERRVELIGLCPDCQFRRSN